MAPINTLDYENKYYSKLREWYHQDSNRGHTDFQSDALPTELWHRLYFRLRVQRYDYFFILQNFWLIFLQIYSRESFFDVFCSLFAYKGEKIGGFVIDDEGIREICLLQQRDGVMVVADRCCMVGITSEDDGHIVSLAELEHAHKHVVCKLFAPKGIERTAVELEEGGRALGSKDYGFNVYLSGCAVAGAGDDVDDGVFDSSEQSGGVLLASAISVA